MINGPKRPLGCSKKSKTKEGGAVKEVTNVEMTDQQNNVHEHTWNRSFT